MTEHRKLISWLESSFVCNWRMLVWHIGDWQLRERLWKSCCKKQPPLHFSTRDTCCCCRGKHLNIFRKGESLSLFPNGYLKLFWIKSRKTFTAVMDDHIWHVILRWWRLDIWKITEEQTLPIKNTHVDTLLTKRMDSQ